MTLFFLMVFLFFVYVRPYEFIPFPFLLSFTRISILISLFFSFIENFRRNIVWKEKSFLYFTSLQILVLFLLPFSAWKANSFDFLVASYWKIFIAFYLLIIVIDSYKRFNLIINTIFISCSIVALRILQAFYSNNYVFDGDGTRRVVGVATLSSDNPNDLALTLAMIIPLGIYLVYTKKGVVKKAIFFIFTILGFFALMYTGSRGGYLGLIFGTLVFFIMKYKNQKGKLLAWFTGIMLTLLLLFPQEYKTRFLSSFNTSDYSYADERYGRIAIWKRSIQSIVAKPLGIGINNCNLAEGEQKQEQGVSGRWNVTHNSYIQVGVELGIVGLLIYLLLLFSGLVNIGKVISLAKDAHDPNSVICACALAGSIAAFMVSSLFLSQAYYWNHYIFIALTVGLKNVLVNKSKDGSV